MANLFLREDQLTPLTAEQVDANFTALNVEIGSKLNSSSYTALDVLSKLLTVDGTGSGLDADLLDGKNSATTNTANTVVLRDSSGDFSARHITAEGFYGSLYGSISGNAVTVTNGVYTTGSYANPDWITSLAGSKITGNITGQAGSVANGVYTNGSYTDPSWLTITASKVGLGNVTNESKSTMFTNAALTGVPTAPTAAAGTNSTQIATTAFVISNGVPSGAILMWSGSVATIPSGWYLCNGTNGTPNLTDRFIIGAGNTYSVGASGGSKDAIVVNHTHTASSVSTVVDPGHKHGLGSTGTTNPDIAYSASVVSTVSRYTDDAFTGISVNTDTTVQTTGASGTDANLPPYYALCFIMKA